jgi:hypothetical protein
MLAPPPRTRAADAAARADEELAVIRRSPRRVTRLYEPALLDRAAQQVVAGDMAVRRAAFLFGVPKSTVHDRSAMAAHCPRLAPPSPGASRVFSDAEEAYLVSCLLYFSDCLLPMTIEMLLKLVGGLYGARIGHNRRPFKASRSWVTKFLVRHHNQLAYSNCVPVSHLHRVTRDHIAELRKVFTDFNKLVFDLRLSDEQVHALDETMLSVKAADASHAKVIPRRGVKPRRRVGVLSEKSTLVAFISANGAHVAPALLQPQTKAVPVPQSRAWNEAAGEPGSLHLPAGKTSMMAKFLFNRC